MKEHGLEVEPDEEEFGYGKLLIDYKPPKKSTSKISNKGNILGLKLLQMLLYRSLSKFNCCLSNHKLCLSPLSLIKNEIKSIFLKKINKLLIIIMTSFLIMSALEPKILHYNCLKGHSV